MKRTPPWVFVAAAAVQLAALGLCVWAMQQVLRRAADEAEADQAPIAPEAPPRIDALAPAPPLTAADAILRNHAAPAPDPIYVPAPGPAPQPPRGAAVPPEPEPDPEPVPHPRPAPPPPPPPPTGQADQARRIVVRAVQVPPERPAGPRFGPPPERPPQPPPDPDAIPQWVTEAADATSQIVRGRAGEGKFAVGFYSDGNIRFVDVDGGRYAGKAESARARMREVDGMRAFTVQFGIAEDKRLQATFTGGPHDGKNIPLEPLVGWSLA